jgi:iron complex transport system substrate-binding protein
MFHMGRISLILTMLFVVAACGAGEPVAITSGEPAATTLAGATITSTAQASTSLGAGFPVTVIAANGEVTIDERPESIISLAPTATEVLYAVGAGPQVLAVDELSNFPEEAPTSDLSGFEPNVEAVAALGPDLVVVSDDINDIVASLTAIGIPVIHVPAAVSLEDTYAQIEQLGAATGNISGGARVVASMQTEVEELSDSIPEPAEPLTYYYELDDTLFTVTSQTFIGQIHALAGLENIADLAEGAETLYPQLSAEYIIDADPDLIFLADTKCCGESPETVAQRPGWDRLSAVANDAVVPLDDDIASRWGPRVVELLRTVVGSVLELQAVSG